MEIDFVVKNIVIGSLQGIFEWLPVSSEGVVSLVLVTVFGDAPSKSIALALWLHLGTLFAVIFYFWQDIIILVKNTPRFIKNFAKNRRQNEPEKLLHFISISTIMTGIIGVIVLKITLEGVDLFGLRATFVIGFFLIITGILQRYARKKIAFKTSLDLNVFDAILLGLFQGLAALPGLSRSGLTISTLLFRGYDDKDALRISFLMSIPAIFGAAVLVLANGGEFLESPYTLLAILFAFIFGVITIKFLMNLAEKLPMWKFAIFLGTITVLFSFLTIL